MRQLEIVAAIDKHKRISGAARALNLSQPAVTRYLRKLEDALSTRIFERTAHGVIATTSGEILIRHAKAIGAELKSADEEIGALVGSGSARIRIGTSVACPTLAPRALALLSRQTRCDAVVVEGVQKNLIGKLLAGDLDIVVMQTSDLERHDGLTERVLCYNRMQVIVRSGHPLTKHRRTSVSDLAKFSWVLPTEGLAPRRQLDNAFRRLGVTAPMRGIETTSFLALRELVLASDMIAVLPEDAAAVELSSGALALLPTDLELPMRAIGVISRARVQHSPGMLKFLSALDDVASEYVTDAKVLRVGNGNGKKSKRTT